MQLQLHLFVLQEPINVKPIVNFLESFSTLLWHGQSQISALGLKEHFNLFRIKRHIMFFRIFGKTYFGSINFPLLQVYIIEQFLLVFHLLVALWALYLKRRNFSVLIVICQMLYLRILSWKKCMIQLSSHLCLHFCRTQTGGRKTCLAGCVSARPHTLIEHVFRLGSISWFQRRLGPIFGTWCLYWGHKCFW